MKQRLSAETVRMIRRQLNETQEEFAKRLMVTKLTVARWETSQRECAGSYAEMIAQLDNRVSQKSASEILREHATKIAELENLVNPVAIQVKQFQEMFLLPAAKAFESQFQQFHTQQMQMLSEVSQTLEKELASVALKYREVLVHTDHIARLGWTIPSLELDFHEFYQLLLGLSKINDPTEADCYVFDWYKNNDPQLKDIEQRLCANRRLAVFSTVLPQCFAAIRREEYAVSIPCLLPILESVLLQLNPQSTDVKKVLTKKFQAAKKGKQNDLYSAISISLRIFIKHLFEQFPLVENRRSTSALSRNAILHGRKAPPNEKIEIIRLLHAIETALNLVDEVLKNEKQSA